MKYCRKQLNTSHIKYFAALYRVMVLPLAPVMASTALRTPTARCYFKTIDQVATSRYFSGHDQWMVKATPAVALTDPCVENNVNRSPVKINTNNIFSLRHLMTAMPVHSGLTWCQQGNTRLLLVQLQRPGLAPAPSGQRNDL